MDEDIKLPEPVAWIAEYGGDVYTADQLRAAVEADRAARVVLSDDHIEDLCVELFVTAQGNSPISEKLARIDAIVRRYVSEQPAHPLVADEICDAWEFITGHQIAFGPSSEGRTMYLSADEVLEFARAIEQAATAPLLARIAELEDELSAIGAGGVGPLMGKESSNE